jgi:hypothetical protein
MEPLKQIKEGNLSELEKLKEQLNKVHYEIYEIENSSKSNSNPGPILALRSLKRQRDILEDKIKKLK